MPVAAGAAAWWLAVLDRQFPEWIGASLCGERRNSFEAANPVRISNRILRGSRRPQCPRGWPLLIDAIA